MKRFLLIFLGLAFFELLVYYSPAYPKKSVFDSYTIKTKHDNVEIDTLNIKFDRHLLVQTSFGEDTTKYWMIFDTGAGLSTIDEELVEKYNLIKFDEEIKTNDANLQMGFLEVFAMPKVKIGKMSFEGCRFVQEPVTTSKCFEKKTYGIIGADIISGLKWLIDYEAEKIYVSTKKEFLPEGKEIFTLPISFDLYSRCPLVDLKLNGLKVEGVSFDTGSDGAISMPVEIFEKNKQLFKNEFRFGVVGEGSNALFGKVNNETGFSFVEEMQVGDLSLSNIRVSFRKKSSKLLGNDVLKYFKLYLDYKSNEIKLISNVEIPKERKGRIEVGYGLKLKFSVDQKVLVSSIIKNSPADKAGIKYNDEVVTINGEVFVGDECDFYPWSAAKLNSGMPMELEIKDKRILKLTYADAFEYNF